VINVVRDSQTKRAPIERIADLVIGYFVPVITLLAILTWTIWLSLGLSGTLPRSYLDNDVGGWRES
jgi:Cu+-exporting ATPase